MRILCVNDGVGDAGGVQRYLTAVSGALRARGHDVALLHLDALRRADESPVGPDAAHFCVTQLGEEAALAAAARWRPTVVFSHNMRALSVEQRLVERWPVAKMMHGYFGTCIGGQKMHGFPGRVACGRRFGPACVVLYLPRHCGQWSVTKLAEQYGWTRAQHALFPRYAAMLVASDHMRDEYARNGMTASRIVVNPLFAAEVPPHPAPAPSEFRVVFLGRMTALKGGDVLIRAVARANAQVRAPIALTMAGDGPSREAWQALSASLGVSAAFPGWVDAGERQALYAAASVVAVPSLWPEPFGLTGLEGGAYGAPALAFDVGGIRAWLRDGVNGWLVPAGHGERGLADRLVAIQGQPAELQTMRTGARRVAEELSLDRHVAGVERVLADAGARGAAA